MFPKVDQLREKLQKEYPILAEHTEKTPKPIKKSISVEPSLVRPTISPNEIANMLQRSSLHKKIKDIDYGPLPKKQIPFKLKVQEYEAELSLNCFMKHIATKSFEKYITEKIPGFRKSAITEIRLPEHRKRQKKKKIEKNMNLKNLEVFGQIESTNQDPKPQEKNLKEIEKSIKNNVRTWCLQEKRKINTEGQIIDHYTFKHKYNLIY